MLNPEFKKEWTEALRSGKFKQTRAYLHNKKGFCCLGVACELLKDKLQLDVTLALDGIVRYDDSAHSLPPNVEAYLGIDADGGYGLKRSLAGDNDNGMTFHEIADIIDKYF